MSKTSLNAFETRKTKLFEAPVLTFPNFDQVFEVECDANGVGFSVVLIQNKCLTAYFSQKLNGSRKKDHTYD